MHTATICLLAGLVAGPARAQDGTASDMLDISRRAAVVDAVLAEYNERIRTSRPFGIQPTVRTAYSSSYYLVPDLSLTTEEGTFDVEFSRAYTGFLIDVLAEPLAEGEAPRPLLYVTGGGMAYGLSANYSLPARDGGEPGTYSDLTGMQFTDEQYAVGGGWRGWSVEGSWSRGQQLQTSSGAADEDSLEDRHQRAQVSANTPIGVEARARWALGGAVEDLAVNWQIMDGAAEFGPPIFRDLRMPEVTIALRKTDYVASTDQRSHPRLIGLAVREDLEWLLNPASQPEDRPHKPRFWGGVQTQADFDAASGRVQTALTSADLAVRGSFFHIELDGGLSLYTDDALIDLVGATTAAGSQAGTHVVLPITGSKCPEKNPDCRTPATALTFAYRYRYNWAEELRQIVDYAEKQQSYLYLELMGAI